MRRLWFSVLGVVAVAAMLVGVNMLADTRLAGAKLDLTQQRLYTLSNGTRKILADLKEPVTLRLYYSRALGSRIPVYGAYADRVQEMLREYAGVSQGKVKLEFYDPEPFSDTEDRALAYGLQGVPIDQSGEQVYFGLAASNLLDDERTIAFFQPERERFLEYDLTRLIYELSNPKRPVVGVMSSLPLDGDPRMMMMRGQGAGAPWVSMLQLRQTFAVKNVQTDAQVIDPDIQVLLVAQAQNLSDNALYAIDQFVMRGGRLMVMVDPHSEAQAAAPSPTGQPPSDTSSNLAKLFDAWGITFDPKTVVGDLNGAWRVRASPGDRVQAVDYVAWFNIRNGVSHDDPATADLTQVTVASPGFIAKKPDADISFTPLLSSSDKSGTLAVDKVKNFPDPAKILAEFKPEGGPRVIAARVRGVLKSAFTGPPDLPKDAKRPDNFPAFKAQTDGPANMVVVADSDILADRYWVRVQEFFGQQDAAPFSDNGPFVANLVGTLAGGDALIGLRSRGSSLRPFDLVEGMQRDAEARFRQTEQQLQTHLTDTQKKLTELRTGRGEAGAAAVITEQQRATIDDLRKEITQTRVKLRNVQLELRRDISRLQNELRLFNIAMVPAILAVLAIVLGFVRRQKRARARA
ncbi:Gldg family protein [Limobrevibacterium gyesilva]|uniref:Gldg family protein n=1 Tax=Limobrevibacterium gyesilva TaxID=2991712 RepID=A0AA41YL20_9PROT|nr:Gldg family protein [Limobrevibacterium gyesilva]MCW3473863.1 Gldg family protein [Limobrevibacterium gyesilva]